MITTFGSFLGLIAAGAPMVFALGVAGALTLAVTTDVPLSIVAQRVYAGLDSFPLMAIPFFVFRVDHGGRRHCQTHRRFAAALVG